MGFSQKFKFIWWIVLLILLTTALLFRTTAILNGSAVPFDALLFIVWMVLMLAPIFEKINLLGIGVEHKAPSERELPKIKQKLEEAPEYKVRHLEESANSSKNDFKLGDDQEFLIALRRSIEIQLQRLWKTHMVSDDRPVPFSSMLNILCKKNVISDPFAQTIYNVYAICSLMVHGQPVSKEQAQFVKDVGEKILSSLKAVR